MDSGEMRDLILSLRKADSVESVGERHLTAGHVLLFDELAL